MKVKADDNSEVFDVESNEHLHEADVTAEVRCDTLSDTVLRLLELEEQKQAALKIEDFQTVFWQVFKPDPEHSGKS